MQINRQSLDGVFNFLFLIYRFEEMVRNPLGLIGSDPRAPGRSVAAPLRLKVKICQDTDPFSKRKVARGSHGRSHRS